MTCFHIFHDKNSAFKPLPRIWGLMPPFTSRLAIAWTVLSCKVYCDRNAKKHISLVSSGSSQDKLQETPLILSHAAKLCQAAIVLTAPTVPKADSGFSRFAKVSSDGSVLAPKRCWTWKRRIGDAASDCRRCGFSANEAPCCSQLSSPTGNVENIYTDLDPEMMQPMY